MTKLSNPYVMFHKQSKIIRYTQFYVKYAQKNESSTCKNE